MNLAIKFFCCLLVLGLAGLFVLKKPDGTPWLSIADFTPDVDVSGISNDASKLLKQLSTETDTPNRSQENTASSGEVYRWKDANGQWQFSDTPPANQQAEAIEVTGDLNRDLVEQVSYKPKKPATESTTPTESALNNATPASLSPDKISTLIKDANNVQQLMDDRGAKIDEYTR